MKWARGLKFAGIHVVVAVFLIACEEIPRWQTEKLHSEIALSRVMLAALQEEQTVEFSPCFIWRSMSWREKLLTASEFPVMSVSRWNEPCPPAWSIAGLAGIDARHHSTQQRLVVDLTLCGLIAIQWIFLGRFPLVKSRRWWLEPGAANTALTVIVVPLMVLGDALASSSIGDVQSAAIAFAVPAFLALWLILLTWIAWLCLIAQRLLGLGWRAAAASMRWARNR